MKKIILILMVILMFFSASQVEALVWDSGHHEFSEGFEGEVWMLNDATADITGGGIGALLCYDTSSVDVYDTSTISLIKPFDLSLVNIFGGSINDVFAVGSSSTNMHGGNINILDARDFSIVNLYTIHYELDPTGGIYNSGLLTGTWIDSGDSFSINLDEGTTDHINFVPEPCTAVFLMIGALVLHHKRGKMTGCKN